MLRNFKFVFLSFIFLYTFSNSVFSQNRHDFGFERSQNVRILRSDSTVLCFPWAGGINSVRASEIDFNLDGIKDLVVFEKHGNRLLPFIRTADSVSPYRFAPEYRHVFPDLHNWAIFKDYNLDGKEDIFCYGLAGITVYQNISTDSLQFQLKTEQLQSFYYNGYTNLYTSTDDYLAIDDIDGDGDLDILNFWLLGKYVHFHKNYAMQNAGNADDFDFRLEDECWGHFEEGGEDNSIILNSDCGQKNDEPSRHIGSTLFMYDFSGNGTPDLVVGDVDYPNLVWLHNGGTPADARMTMIDTLFPNPLQPIWLYSMPVINMIDINGDGQKELLASPSDPSLTKSQDNHSFLVYQYNADIDEYEMITDSFLQNEMIETGSGAYPVFYDWDRDGLQDLFIANYGSYDSSALHNGYLSSYFSSSIIYLKNIGTIESPVFQYVTNDFGNLKSQNWQALYPTFGDFDGNGTCDMLCGNIDGTLLLFPNLTSSGLPQFEPEVRNYAGIDVGDFSTPQYFDLDKDGMSDLMIGNRRGQIAYYRNISVNIPDFYLITDTLGGVDIRDENTSFFGFSVPCFFRNSHNETFLFCGTEQGSIAYFKNIDDNLDESFLLSEEKMFEVFYGNRYDIIEGVRVGVAVADIDNDSYPEMIVGNYAGGVAYFDGIMPPPIDISIQQFSHPSSLKVYPNPASRELHIDCQQGNIIQLSIFDAAGKMVLTQNNVDQPALTINVSHLSNGFYIGKIVTDQEQTCFKIMISRQ